MSAQRGAVRLEWAPAALADLLEILAYIAADSPQAAADLQTSVQRRAARLEQFPHSGRIGRVAGTRELVLTPYILVYILEHDAAIIVRMLHGSRLWPVQSEPESR